MATSTKAAQLASRAEKRTLPNDILGRCIGLFELELDRSTRLQFPNPRYAKDPVAFAREILGVEPWSGQIEILEAIRDYLRVAVASGRRVGKSNSIAIVALWFYCSFPDARVIMTSTTARQVDQILWRELRMLRARSGRCLACKAEDPTGRIISAPCPHSATIDADTEGELARTGLKSKDFREIVGFTARESEAIQGIAGSNLLFLADEASGIPDIIFEAIEGNRAGGARLALFGNPTRNEGTFFEAFYSQSQFYKSIRISSEESPNVTAGQVLIPGLATREWIDDMREMWGEQSALYRIHVLGEHALHEEGRIFSVHAIATAENGWADAVGDGRLFIGIDPAGSSGTGDESAFSVRRGHKQLALRVQRGLNEDGHLVQALALINEFRGPREKPVVVIDREGEVGSKLAIAMRRFVEANPETFELVCVRASDGAVRNPVVYHRIRDELAASLEQWFRDGGTIVTDVKLAKELHVLQWKQDARGKMKVTAKDLIRKELGRSPDRYDALALSVWEPLSLRAETSPTLVNHTTYRGGDDGALARVFDPYAGSDAFR